MSKIKAIVVLITLPALVVAGLLFFSKNKGVLPPPSPPTPPSEESQILLPEQVVSSYIEQKYSGRLSSFEITRSGPQAQPAIYEVVVTITLDGSFPATHYFSLVKKEGVWTVVNETTIPIVGSTPPLP